MYIGIYILCFIYDLGVVLFVSLVSVVFKNYNFNGGAALQGQY